jgi:G3E family GTPase
MTDTKFIDTATGKLHLKLAKIHLANSGLPSTGNAETIMMSMDDFLENVAAIRVPSSKAANQVSKEMAPSFRHPWPSSDMFRTKGVLNVQGEAARFVFQGVHMLIDGGSGKPWGDTSPRLNELVFIGRGLDRAALNEGFRSCLV